MNRNSYIYNVLCIKVKYKNHERKKKVFGFSSIFEVHIHSRVTAIPFLENVCSVVANTATANANH